MLNMSNCYKFIFLQIFMQKAVQVEAVKAEDYISPPVAARTRRNKGVSPSRIPRRILPKDNEALAEIEQARALLNEDASDLSDSEVSISQKNILRAFMSNYLHLFLHDSSLLFPLKIIACLNLFYK